MSESITKISKQAWMEAPETRRIMDALRANGGSARFVGGCVRNTLANVKVVDIDIATPQEPEDVIAKLNAAKISYVPTGLKHGTVTAVVDGKPFEITTLRVDVLTFGRHAEVKYTDDWKTDAARRDFTINAMSADIDGTVYDYFNGIEDLRLGRIVFVGDAEKRIREDVLRILRYFRFLAHFGKGVPDAPALQACQKLSSLLPKLSAERIRQETLKLLEADGCADVWHLMLQAGVVTHFLPEATDTAALQRLTHLENNYEEAGFSLRRLAALLQVTPEGIAQVEKSLRLSRAQGEFLNGLLTHYPNISLYMDAAEVRTLVYRHGSDLTRSLLLLTAAKSGAEGELRNLYEEATSFRPPRFPLTGDDVIALGWTAGPDVGHVLEALESWWIAEDFTPGRTACLEKLRSEYTPR